ncbi:MAG: glycosyltransferase family 2 protein [Ruminococcaceae bacterium]|nr:glycosyltransferase family 2 protein [Oscillospiraceae bacterium]
MLISYVIPCYRSGDNIVKVVSEIKGVMAEHQEYDYEIILVNDCSPDNTYEILKKLCAENKMVTSIDLAKNKGQASATICGLRHAKGDYIVCGDDDGQTPFDIIFSLKDKLDNEDFDVVCGKYVKRDRSSLFRKIGTKINEIMTHSIMGYPKGLYMSAYFIAKRFVIDELIKYPNPYPYITGLLFQITSKIGNVEVPQRKRLEGKSGYTFKKLLALWINGFTAFSIKPLRIATITGILFSILGFLITILLVVVKLVNPNVAIGWTSLTALMFVIGGVVLLVIGMIGEYVGRIYISLNKFPQYVVRDVTKGSDEGAEG